MKNNHSLTRSWRHLPAVVVLILGWLFAGQAQAVVSGGIICTMPGVPVNGYEAPPGAQISIPIEGTCTAKRPFPQGLHVNYDLYTTAGSTQKMDLGSPIYNVFVPMVPIGTRSGICFDTICGSYTAGKTFTYSFFLTGQAPKTPGFSWVYLSFGYTSAYNTAVSEWIFKDSLYRIRVLDNTCTLKSPSSVSLSFGSISSANLDNEKQSTSVVVDCPSAKSANVSLMPTQGIVDASTGLARTTLSGLNMRASWTDTASPVNLGVATTMQLRSGSNALNLSFKPQLASTQAPVGAFQSQYTLVINYL